MMTTQSSQSRAVVEDLWVLVAEAAFNKALGNVQQPRVFVDTPAELGWDLITPHGTLTVRNVMLANGTDTVSVVVVSSEAASGTLVPAGAVTMIRAEGPPAQAYTYEPVPRLHEALFEPIKTLCTLGFQQALSWFVPSRLRFPS
jgi:hypothetical protein